MKKTLLDNNKITARAEQAMLDRIPVDQRTLRIIGKTLEPKNLKRIGIAAVGGSLLISMISTLGRDRLNRAETARELKKQLMPLQKGRQSKPRLHPELLLPWPRNDPASSWRMPLLWRYRPP